MDCFYAAIELRERPELEGRPIAVGGGSRRGVVTTCNYEARKFGVRSAMPGFKARDLCPELVFLPVRFDLYRAESAKIREILLSYTQLVEPLSLDEAYLDVTDLGSYAWDIARELRARIFTATGLTCSAGIAPNKMLAKIASDWRKPNGQFAILPEEIEAFMRRLPVRKLWGVGPKSADRFAGLGIYTCEDLQRYSLADIVGRFGRWGRDLYYLCRGVDDRPVEPNRVRKSLRGSWRSSIGCTATSNIGPSRAAQISRRMTLSNAATESAATLLTPPSHFVEPSICRPAMSAVTCPISGIKTRAPRTIFMRTAKSISAADGKSLTLVSTNRGSVAFASAQVTTR